MNGHSWKPHAVFALTAGMLGCILTPTTSLSTATAAERPVKPNVVLILTDDLGWQDVKCYDIDEPSPMETPNIDAFAKKGVMTIPSRTNILECELLTRGGVLENGGVSSCSLWLTWTGA